MYYNYLINDAVDSHIREHEQWEITKANRQIIPFHKLCMNTNYFRMSFWTHHSHSFSLSWDELWWSLAISLITVPFNFLDIFRVFFFFFFKCNDEENYFQWKFTINKNKVNKISLQLDCSDIKLNNHKNFTSNSLKISWLFFVKFIWWFYLRNEYFVYFSLLSKLLIFQKIKSHENFR